MLRRIALPSFIRMLALGFLVLLLPVRLLAEGDERTYRLCDGITAFVVNEEARDFTVTLDVRDLNIYEPGPRELLLKVYDPDGRTVVREVIPDDGVTKPAYTQPAGAWDHEAWYYAYCHMQGTAPMIRWSAFSEPDRLATLAKRTFTYRIPGNRAGIYRILLVGGKDHYVTMKLDPDLKYGISGHPTFLHGHGEQYRRRFIYVPRGSRGLHFVAGEWDRPASRRFTLTTLDGETLFEDNTTKGFLKSTIDFDEAGQFDDQILVLQVGRVEGALPAERSGAAGGTASGDYLLEIKHRFSRHPQVSHRGEAAVSAVLAPDADTARAVRGGAIYHDDQVFWQACQVRLHDWLKGLDAEDFIVRSEEGEEIGVGELPAREGFIPVNSKYYRPPLCDQIMHHWPEHRNRAALNLALRDLAAGLRSIGPNDHVAVAVGGPFANMGYEFSNYAWHYWRPGWRILQQSDAPDEVKDILKEAFLTAGDRLAFCRSWARVNGNSFALVPAALKYCSAATGDDMQKQLFETYFDRFAQGGWGERVGVGPSGPIQEGFAYAYHYASYPVQTWLSVLADFPEDQRFPPVYDRMRMWFSYTLAGEQIAAGPWSSRTHFYPHWGIEREGRYAWKGLPGPDFTVSVNDGNEWFAARRKGYYVLTYHGRLSPKWNGNAHAGQSGYGGGMICQLHIPDRGPVLASTLNGDYGRKMHGSLWPTFHLHSVVGEMADGRPLITADSEHLNARLHGTTVTGSAELRSASVHVKRSYQFGEKDVQCRVELGASDHLELLNLWVPNELQGKIKGAWEMIPFVANKQRQPKTPIQPTDVTLFDARGNELGTLADEPMEAEEIVVDRGGFGIRIRLDRTRRVQRGQNHTILIQLVDTTTADTPVPAEDVSLEYRLVPFSQP